MRPGGAAWLPAALALALAGCGRATPDDADTPGARIERAAVAAGVVADPARLDPAGAYASDSDHLCIRPGAGEGRGGGYRIGVAVDYGDGHACVGRGTARGTGRIAVALSDRCRFDAQFDGERLAFPAVLPPGCDDLCTGRASLSALAVARLSAADAEAAALRGPDRRALCD